MDNLKNKKYFLILANFRYTYIALLFIMGVFLFPNVAHLSTISTEKIIDLSNKERVDNNLAPLTANQYLSQAAYNKALDIFQEQKFEHNFDDRRFSAWVQDVNYKYRYVGENLAIDFVSDKGVINAWKLSPTHYENIINEKFTEIGVAVIEDIFNNKASVVVVQIFGTPLENGISLNSIDGSQNITSNQTKYLTHSSQGELAIAKRRYSGVQNSLNITFEEKIFSNLETGDSTDYILDNENKQKLPDLLFTLVGFVYLGAFKMVSFKNIGL